AFVLHGKAQCAARTVIRTTQVPVYAATRMARISRRLVLAQVPCAVARPSLVRSVFPSAALSGTPRLKGTGSNPPRCIQEDHAVERPPPYLGSQRDPHSPAPQRPGTHPAHPRPPGARGGGQVRQGQGGPHQPGEVPGDRTA